MQQGKTCEERFEAKHEKLVAEICGDIAECIVFIDDWRDRKVSQCDCIQPAREAFKEAR